MLSVTSSGVAGGDYSEGLGVDLKGSSRLSDAGTSTPPVGMDRRRSSTSNIAPSKETLRLLETVWKQVMETAVEYCQVSQDIGLSDPFGRD
jgi:hypothetical protein